MTVAILWRRLKKIFKSYIDPDFKNRRFNKPGKPTKEIAVAVYEIVKNGTFAQIFGSFGVDLDELSLTQHQIEVFCEMHLNWLYTDGYGTFFPTKKDWDMPATLNNLFVAGVIVYSAGLGVYASRFGDGLVWSYNYRPRLVVPQLETY